MNQLRLSRAAVRELDRRAAIEFGVSGLVLMENAGRGAADVLHRLNPERRRTLILCGPGNNGGDGFVMARHLQYWGVELDVLLFGEVDRLPADAKANALAWQKCGPLWTVPANGPLDVEVKRIVAGAQGWIVDALFGTGLSRPLGEPFAELVGLVNSRGLPILAVDISSGLDCDTGNPLGATIRANHTATFVAEKTGFANSAAQKWLGDVHIVEIGASRALVDSYR